MSYAREWAKKNGWPNLADRGRIPKDALDAFERANPAPDPDEVSAFSLVFECPTISTEEQQMITDLLVGALYAVFMAGWVTRDATEET